MSRDSVVTFEQVSKACFELLGRGERPARQSVQELLATDRYLGRKGSTDLVNKYINDFWASMAKTFQMPTRVVAGVPEAFVPIIDKALVEMVAVARQVVSAEFADREVALDSRAKEMEASIQEARDTALAADQLRVRAEGELSALQTRAAELKSNLADAERKLADESRKVEAHQRTIGEKDAELRRQNASLEAAHRSLEQANELHRQEVHRLMQQLDNERQGARKEAQRQAEQLERSRGETVAAREESTALREDNARLKAEGVAAAASKATLEASLKDTKARLDGAETKLQAAQQEVTVLRVRYETAEQHRQEAVARNTSQAEELGEFRRANGQLEQELAALRDKSNGQRSPEVPK